jgi:hypothetical protein
MASRKENERTFGSWTELSGGGRRYTREYAGRAGGRARYIKEVDGAEATVRFAEEIYDRDGHLVSVHEKFPVDLGHERI